ncbi:hypothetical protein [Sphaerimonospora thailandensis]|uniref:Uncharacterized protein n=1 Tax=Sphaerimonospora thailandensis TaxID=795644 RepID=A0A8J3RAT5_9ACTN|nr:hypothetical protein [Sphaerimonospora thailandensis]GIH72611.1 hypothetical protein Mth01_48640 [Sphaerimonospora thailandensis]
MNDRSPDGEAVWAQHSRLRVVPPVQPRKLAKVPFVELADGRLQGVVSSGSDISRVYVSSIAAGTHNYNCSTNNNRPCGGLYGSPCKHLRSLAAEAVLQYGPGRVARYLRVDVPDGAELIDCLTGAHEPAPAAMVFSRFLRHLAYLEVPTTTMPIPEMHWFPAEEAVR